MYLSTLEVPGSLISESRTSASSSSQVSMTLSACTLPIHRQPCIRTLYTDNPHGSDVLYTPYTQDISCICTLYTDSPCTHQKIGFSINPRILSSTLHATSNVRYFKCIHKYLQEALHKKIDIQYVQVCFMSELCLLFISSCSLTLSLF
jgi:hypothetical protein